MGVFLLLLIIVALSISLVSMQTTKKNRDRPRYCIRFYADRYKNRNPRKILPHEDGSLLKEKIQKTHRMGISR